MPLNPVATELVKLHLDFTAKHLIHCKIKRKLAPKGWQLVKVTLTSLLNLLDANIFH